VSYIGTDPTDFKKQASGLPAALRHLELLTGSRDTPVWFRAFTDAGKGEARKFFGTVAGQWSEIESLQAAGCGIFVVVNEGGNTREEVLAAGGLTRAVFVDGDNIPAPAKWHADPDFLVIRDQMHWHAYWLPADLLIADFEEAQRRLAAHYGTDTRVKDPSRVMRLAGTFHLKEPAHPRLIQLKDCNADRAPARPAADILVGLPEVPKANRERQGAPEGLVEADDVPELTTEARRIIDRFVAGDKDPNPPTPTGNRCYVLANLLGDLRHAGRVLSGEAIASILVEHWQSFDSETVLGTVENALRFRANDRGCTPAGSAETFKNYRDTAETWSEPLDIFGRITSEPVLTRDMLPPVIADYAFDVAERIGVDPAMVACAMLATSAAAIDDSIQIQPKVLDDSWLESARLNFLIAAPVGAAKTPAIKAATRPLTEIDAGWQKEDAQKIAEWEDDAKVREAARKHIAKEVQRNGEYTPEAQNPLPAQQERPVKRRLVINDTTTEGVCRILKDNPRGVLLEVDEAMGWISSFDAYRNGSAGKDRAFWLQADNGGHYAKDRADEKASFLVPNLSVSIIGGIQPEKLRSIAKDLHDDGLIQRAFVIRAGAGKRGIDREPNRHAKNAYAALLERLVNLTPAVPAKPIKLDFDAQGDRDIVEDLAQAFIALPTTPAAFKQHLAKWPGRFNRLLLLFHVIDGGIKPYVNGETAARVRNFMERYLLPQQHRFYTEYFRGIRPAEADMEWIAGYILAHRSDEVSAREIKRGNHEMTDDSIRDAMNVLTEANWLGQPVEERAKRSISWPVNPRVHVLFAERAAAERQRREETKRVIAEAASKVKAADCQ
jgi:hypothetical protein